MSQSLLQLIRERRSVFPGQYTGESVDRAVIAELLELANRAPTHRMTQPWRFVVFHENDRQKLSEYMMSYYDAHTPEAERSELKRSKAGKNPLKAAAVIAIVMSRDPEERVPEWEELAAVACAVQNILLGASALGLGAYWSTPRAALEARDWLGLAGGESCLGLVYLGVPAELPPLSPRGPVADKTRWGV